MAPGLLSSPLTSHAPLASVTPHPPANGTLTPKQSFLTTLTDSPWTFLQPPTDLQAAALQLAKQYLDPLAASVSQIQEVRLQNIRRKRKRGDKDADEARNILRLRQIHLDGFGIDQVWEQARRVLDASRHEIERSLPAALPESGEKIPAVEEDASPDPIKVVAFDQDGFELGSGTEDEEGDDIATEGGSDEELEGVKEDLYDQDDLDEEEDIIEGDESDLGMEDDSDGGQAEEFKADVHGLNDGFFSIDDFNRQTEFLEQRDAQGDLDDDDEEIDWDADPVAQLPSKADGKPSKPSKLPQDDEDAEFSEDDGPTFGNADLNAPFSDTNSDNDEVDLDLEDVGLSNTNEIHYADFFAPPALPTKKSYKNRPLPKTQPSASQGPPTDEDIQRTISAVRRDLFEDDFPDPDASASDDDDVNDTTNLATARLSSHEKRQLKIQAQIRKLEAENIAKRKWTLSGEARAAERPLNSLLEEDLEFERAGKPVPVITAAVSEDIEALIKRRILAREFDEVVKRRPESLAPSGSKRGVLPELDDTKSKVGLGELYAEDHLKVVDPEGFARTKDEGTRKQYEEVERLWKELSGLLDGLSSLHYRPRQPEVQVKVVADVPAVRMEEARPSGAEGLGGEGSMLAPQEVFKIGDTEGAGKEEVVTGTGLVARAEMTREEKLRRRRREKERIRKREGSGKGKSVVVGKVGKDGEKREGKKDVVDTLRKGGVRVIGPKGELRDVEGKKAKAVGAGGAGGAANFKL